MDNQSPTGGKLKNPMNDKRFNIIVKPYSLFLKLL